jgi:hypothetical protein
VGTWRPRVTVAMTVPSRRSKPRRVPVDRNPDYLAFLRYECRCVVCEIIRRRTPRSARWVRIVLPQCDAAHGPVNGMGSKGPDTGAIPLCRAHHAEQHHIGWPAFCAKYELDREKEAKAHHALYLLHKEHNGTT